MKKVLFILNDLQGGGAERVVLNVLRHLDRSRFIATLFLFKREGVYWDEVPDNVRVVCATKRGRLRYTLPCIFLKLLKEARAQNVIVGALELTPTYLAYLAGKIFHKPTVGWVHTSFASYIALMKRTHQYISRYVYSRMSHLVFVSRGARQSMRSWLNHQDPHGWEVIYNAVDLSIHSVTGSETYIAETAFSAPVVIAIGRLAKQKGFDILIRAHASLIEHGCKHHLLILGEGAERSKLERLASDLGVSDSVFMPGFVPNPLQFLKQSRVFVLSSHFEGLPMVLLEALAAGVPIVATDCPSGPAEILENGKYGLLVPPENLTALGEAIGRMLTDPALRSRYQSLGTMRVKDFSPERIIQYWQRLLLKITK